MKVGIWQAMLGRDVKGQVICRGVPSATVFSSAVKRSGLLRLTRLSVVGADVGVTLDGSRAAVLRSTRELVIIAMFTANRLPPGELGEGWGSDADCCLAGQRRRPAVLPRERAGTRRSVRTLSDPREQCTMKSAPPRAQSIATAIARAVCVH